MSCKACEKKIKTAKSEYQKAVELAQRMSKADNKVYVVIKDGDIYYPECITCRNGSKEKRGEVVAYIG